MKCEKTRDVVIDNIKAFAIVLVVLGHSLQYLTPLSSQELDDLFNNYLFRVVYVFHMPLFILVSGMFHSNKYFALDFFVRCFKRLIVPMFFFAIFNNVVQLILVDNFVPTFKTYFHSFFYDYWFLWCLFECKCLLYCLKYVRSKYTRILILILLYFLPIPLPRYNLLLSLLPFYAMGAYWKHNKKTLTNWCVNCSYWYVLLLFILAVFFTVIWKSQYSIYGQCYGIPAMLDIETYFNYFVRIFGGMSYIMLIICLYYKRVTKITQISELGKMTLGIYLLQYTYVCILKNYTFEFINFSEYLLASIFFTIVCLLVSYMIVTVMQRIKIFNHYFLGNV